MVRGTRTLCRTTYYSIFLVNLTCELSLLVIGATVVHPVTSRTRSLRLSAPMVLGGRPPGRVGHCQETFF